MYGLDLNEEQRALQDVAKKFAEKEIAPIAEKLDKSQNLLQDFPWDMVRKADALGLRTVGLPEEYGGPGYDLRTWLVMIDEMTYVDICCSKILTQCWKLARGLAMGGTKAQKDKFLPAFRDDPTYLLGGASTEPGAGADNHLPYEGADGGVKLSAVRQGDHYVLNGRKHFISHSPVAKLLSVAARTDKTVGGDKGKSNFLVPTDTPGFKVVRVHDKVGFRMYLQGELEFDNVKLPVENLVGGKEGGGREGHVASIELAAHAMALARRALDEAIRYANDRVQGGKRIIEHQSIAKELAELYQLLHAGRGLVWHAAWTVDTGNHDPALTGSCKVFCTEAALKICLSAMEMFGGSGVMRELPMQKYARDAMCLRHLEGTNNVNLLRIGKTLETRFNKEGRLSR